jgi:CRP-like cAMP-binding protein
MALEEDASVPAAGDTARMTEEDMRLLRAVGSESVVPAGKLLIEHGHLGTGLFVILEGSVVVQAPEGVRTLGPGTVVGERALASSSGRRTARVHTASEVRVLAVPRAEIDRLTTADASLAGRIAAAAG